MCNFPSPRARAVRRHIICERDVGLFSLVQQVIAHLPWAFAEDRVPIVYYTDKTCYWKPGGYQGRDNVWEYYFEPLVSTHPAATIPARIRRAIKQRHPRYFSVGYAVDKNTFVSGHFGDHPKLREKTISIPYLWDDPDDALRKRVSPLIRSYVRPRAYLQDKVNAFFERHLRADCVIGVHIRGTDAISRQEKREHRQGSLKLPKFKRKVDSLLKKAPDARIFVATDDESSLEYMRAHFGRRIVAYDSIRHREGEFAGAGPTGWIMPAYIASDPGIAAKNGEEAVIEYLLLGRCSHLVHNASGMARNVLLAAPELPHTNTHRKPRRLA